MHDRVSSGFLRLEALELIIDGISRRSPEIIDHKDLHEASLFF